MGTQIQNPEEYTHVEKSKYKASGAKNPEGIGLHSPPKEKYNHTKGPLKSNFSDFSTSIA
jgi:hypothetical protein